MSTRRYRRAERGQRPPNVRAWTVARSGGVNLRRYGTTPLEKPCSCRDRSFDARAGLKPSTTASRSSTWEELLNDVFDDKGDAVERPPSPNP